MNYIVNPMWFYWMQVVNGLSVLFGVATLLMFITITVVVIINEVNYSVEKDWHTRAEITQALKIRKFYKPMIIFLIVSALLCVAIPSRDTMISMLIAKHATYDNAQITVETIKSAVDYIIQAIQSVK